MNNFLSQVSQSVTNTFSSLSQNAQQVLASSSQNIQRRLLELAIKHGLTPSEANATLQIMGNLSGLSEEQSVELFKQKAEITTGARTTQLIQAAQGAKDSEAASNRGGLSKIFSRSLQTAEKNLLESYDLVQKEIKGKKEKLDMAVKELSETYDTFLKKDIDLECQKVQLQSVENELPVKIDVMYSETEQLLEVLERTISQKEQELETVKEELQKAETTLNAPKTQKDATLAAINTMSANNSRQTIQILQNEISDLKNTHQQMRVKAQNTEQGLKKEVEDLKRTFDEAFADTEKDKEASLKPKCVLVSTIKEKISDLESAIAKAETIYPDMKKLKSQ